MTRYLFITGGVLSSLGKGVASAAIGALLELRGYRVSLQKFDPYLNVDPGTLTPYQHGEVFVTRDGAETDLDVGHYERFTSVNLTRRHNSTSGQVYHTVIQEERQGAFLGKTVQVVPHITSEIKKRFRRAASRGIDFVISEVGGTVGDIESLPFLEAIRQFRHEVGIDNVCCLHLTYIPWVRAAGELKTKPTQHSVERLRAIGFQPDILLCRTEKALSLETRKKISLFCNVSLNSVIEARDTDCIYRIPLIFSREKLDLAILRRLHVRPRPSRLGVWQARVEKASSARARPIGIALVGKYVHLQDTYKSIDEALHHGATANDRRVEIRKIDSELFERSPEKIAESLAGVSGVLIPGGFGIRGIEGMISVIRHARENRLPFFGICLGLQAAVVEYGRHVLGWESAHSTEFDPDTPHPVVKILPSQESVTEMGGTMRLGAFPCVIRAGTLARRVYGRGRVSERHRHRYEVNPDLFPRLSERGLVASGVSPDGKLVEVVEISGHPFFIATQFHPEFQSRFLVPHPLFVSFLAAAVRHEARNAGNRPEVGR